MTYRLGRILFYSTNYVSVLAGILVALMMLQISADVIARYIFGAPLPATLIFVSHYYMLAVIFLPQALPERTNSHISVEIITELLPARIQHHLASWIHLLCAVVYGMISWASWGEAVAKFRTKATIIENALVVPIWPGYFIIPIGCALMCAVLIYRFLTYATGARSGLGETPVTGTPSTLVKAPAEETVR
jgi:TRAP-type C4-dicarboxylate transport system permease small subunit